MKPQSMKTRPHRSQRKHTHKASRRLHGPALRRQAGRPASAPPQQQQKAAAGQRSPLEVVCANAEVCGDGMNIIRSTVSDEEGSYIVMSLETPAPFTVAYDAWTRFELLPHFMRGQVKPSFHDESQMTWRIRTLFDQFAWQAKVYEQQPFDHIAWKSEPGTPHPSFGSVSFEPISHLRTWVIVQVAFDMSGLYRWLGDPLPSLSQSLERSLKHFHQTIAAPAAN